MLAQMQHSTTSVTSASQDDLAFSSWRYGAMRNRWYNQRTGIASSRCADLHSRSKYNVSFYSREVGEGIRQAMASISCTRLNQLTCLAPRPWHRRVVFATMELLVLEYLSPDWVISCLSTGKDACMVKVKWLDEECGVLLEGLSGYADGATRSGGRRYKREEYSRVEAKILQFDKESCGGLQAYLSLSISLPLV